PHVKSVRVNGVQFKSQSLSKSLLTSAHCVLITTDHSSYDYESIVANAKRVIDTRNATKNVKKNRDKIVLLGDGK
ncbi:MAG TPA: UDP-N-acetyl-D-glucosamine dehydrogenase, partial [Bacteroidota bacterium]